MDYDEITDLIEGISTEDGLSIIYAIAQKLDAISVVYLPNDVMVENSDGDCFPIGDWDAEDGEITEAMIQAITGDKRWYRWIEESMSERGSEMLPTLRLLDDGNFSVSWPY